jgi:hypothetical protein
LILATRRQAKIVINVQLRINLCEFQYFEKSSCPNLLQTPKQAALIRHYPPTTRWNRRENPRLELTSNKTPAFLRREGRRKRKAGAKNEKAILLYHRYFADVKEKITQISTEKTFFIRKVPFFIIQKTKNRQTVVSSPEEDSVAI